MLGCSAMTVQTSGDPPMLVSIPTVCHCLNLARNGSNFKNDGTKRECLGAPQRRGSPVGESPTQIVVGKSGS